MTDKMPVISFSGIWGSARKRGKIMIETLKGRYSGALQPGVTTHLVVSFPGNNNNAPSEKLLLARRLNIPVIDYEWIEESFKSGSWKEYEGYQVHCWTRSTAASRTRSALPSPERLRAAWQADDEAHDALFINPLFTQGLLLASTTGKLGRSSLSSALVLEAAGPAVAMEQQVDTVLKTPPSTQSNQLNELSADMISLTLVHQEEEEKGHKSSQCDNENIISNYLDYANLTIELSPSAAALRVLPSSIVLAGPRRNEPTDTVILTNFHACHTKSAKATFFESAMVMLQDGRRLHFTAGNMSHGACMLYDIDESTGRHLYARVAIRAIYSLMEDPNIIMMQHHFLFSIEDQQERRRLLAPDEKPPAWLAALESACLAHNELAISMSSGYASPMHLITDDFKVQFNVETKKRRGRPRKQQYLADRTYNCRLAIDTIAGAVLDLDKISLEMHAE